MSAEALYPIKEISRLTGINPITLRAWERRYALIEPVRTDTGRRLYNHDHIETVKEAIELTNQGILIGQVKRILEEREQAALKNNVVQDYPAAIKQALQSLDLHALKQIVDVCFSDLMDRDLNDTFRKVVMKATDNELCLLESMLVPRVQTRINVSYRSLDFKSIKPIVLLVDDQVSNAMVSLCELWLAQRGSFAVIKRFSELTDHETLEMFVAEMGCEGIALLNYQTAVDEARWQGWCKQHPSMSLYIFSDQPVIEKLMSFIQVTYLDLNAPFDRV